MSNWERRPLRLSQQHYAAMDAYILVEIIQKLAEKGQQDGGSPLQRFVFTLDKRQYNPGEPEDEDEKYYDKDDEAPRQVTIGSKQTMTQ
jgi:ribonuclease D